MRSIAEANADQTEARGSEENVRLTVSVLMNVLEKLRTMDKARFTKVVEALFAKDDDGNKSAKMTSPEERESTGKTERAENYIPRHGKPCEEEDPYGRVSAEQAAKAVADLIKCLKCNQPLIATDGHVIHYCDGEPDFPVSVTCPKCRGKAYPQVGFKEKIAFGMSVCSFHCACGWTSPEGVGNSKDQAFMDALRIAKAEGA